MAREREVATLWIGGGLTWLEQLCLKSFVDRGQKITLFSYGPIPNVPQGVLRRDGREIVDTEDFIKYEKKDSYALFADYFRLRLLAAWPGVIWVDTDVYCHRPMDYDDDHVMGFELPGSTRVNNAVLGLPAGGPILTDLLDFVSDRYPVPPFLPARTRRDYVAAREQGAPVHVSQQPWGVWGPLMLTHFVARHGLLDRVQPLDAFYPVTFRERTLFLRSAQRAEARLTARTTALHLWASNKRELGLRHGGLPPKGSFLEQLVRRHGVRSEHALIGGRGPEVFEAGLIERLRLPSVATVADLGLNARTLILAAHMRHDCDIDLVDMDAQGRFRDSPRVADYLGFLAENDVPSDRIRVVRDAKSLRRYDLLARLASPGETRSFGNLDTILAGAVHADSAMIVDIPKGSGGYPYLRRHGTTEPLSVRGTGRDEVHRLLFRLKPPEPAPDDDWAAIARGLAGNGGFYREAPQHSFLFVPRGDDTLVVTFDNLDIAMTKREERRPWGYHFIEKQGWSMLGVMANGWTWYRDPWVAAEFDRLREEGFFARFRRVVFYGASMGGYAACAYSAACPGADVVAISPQSTLDKTLVPWETRYRSAWGYDYSGRYGDAAAASSAARRVTLFYDPYSDLDARHAARFTAGNVRRMRAPLMGHRLGTALQQMGILNAVILDALDGRLETLDFHRRLRARREFPRYQWELFQRALDRDRPGLAKRLGRWVLARGSHAAIRRRMETL